MKYTINHCSPQEKEQMFLPGTILWRGNIGVWASGYKAHLTEDVELVKTDRDYRGRVHLPGQHIFDPCVTGARVGFVTFIKGEPQKNWTHAVITGAKFNKEGKGGTLFAEFAPPMPQDHYMDFRQRMANQYKELLNCHDIEKIIDAARLHHPTIPTGLKRLICNYNYQTEMWDFVHIKY